MIYELYEFIIKIILKLNKHRLLYFVKGKMITTPPEGRGKKRQKPMEHVSIKQLKYYEAETTFTIKAINPATGGVKVMNDISINAYERGLGYLKFLNFSGYNIYFSPAFWGGCGYLDILLDDISKESIEQLNQDGLNPLYFLETSGANFQAVVRLSENCDVSDEVKNSISKELCDIYKADKNSSDAGHFFRLAGYSNRKEKYCKGGLYPFVKLYNGGGVAKKGQELLENFIAETKRKEKIININIKQSQGPGNCAAYIKKIYDTSNMQDLSSLDFKVCKYALEKGFSQVEIENAIRQYSPELETRKKGHIDDYIKRTINAAASK